MASIRQLPLLALFSSILLCLPPWADDRSCTSGEVSFGDISADGRYVVFQSDATNLVAEDTNGKADTFLYDRTTGETTRVSVANECKQTRAGSDGLSDEEEDS